MSVEWSVTTERLESSAAFIEDKTSQYNSEWSKLYSEIQNLRSAQWKGIASETFNSKLEGYKNDFEELSKILISYAEFLKSAANNYRSTEQQIKDAAGNLYTGR